MLEEGLSRVGRDDLLAAKYAWSKKVNTGSHDFDDDRADDEDNGDGEEDTHPEMLDFLFTEVVLNRFSTDRSRPA
ncbi:hypothetical protein ASD02_25325 [Ensifer sp. Root1252]|nr:hypothetical protein ASD02_25325 [Ensifer sp. Root1252]